MGRPKDTIALIFSKDRAMQLQGTIESFLLHCRDEDAVDFVVLYKVSNGLHRGQYDELKKKFSQVSFIEENDFRSQVLSVLQKCDYVLFLVDDNIFVRPFSVQDMSGALGREKDTAGFSLRLGRNTGYCYPLSSPQALPAFREIGGGILKYYWPGSQCDFGYPLEMSSSVYRCREILQLLGRVEFANPNRLEGIMDLNKHLYNNLPYLLTFAESAAFCNPVNVVQNTVKNRHGVVHNYSSEKLADYFSRGMSIDVKKYIGFKPNAAHQEVELYFTGAGEVSVERREQAGERSEFGNEAAKPKFSIIMANYNNAKYVGQAVESVLNQTFKDWELVIVDDCSTDNSLQIIKQYLHDGRIRLIQHESNRGYAAALKTGIANVGSDYFGILDSDDCLVPEAVETMYNSHINFADCGLIYSQYAVCSPELTPKRTGHCKGLPPGKTNLDVHAVSHFKTFKMRDYLKTSGYDEEILYAEDKDIIYKMEEVTRLKFVEQCLYLYRELPNSHSHDSEKAHIGRESMEKAKMKALIRRGLMPVGGPPAMGREVQGIMQCRPVGYQAGESAPKISVIVATHNRPKLLERCLEGFVGQTAAKEDFEVIVVDDGSDPPARDTVESYADRINVTYLYQENLGLAAARNAGVRAVAGEIILFSDDDDLADAALVEEHLKKHQEHPDERTVVLGHLQWHPELRITPLMHYVTEEGGEYFGYVNMQDGGVYNGWKWWGGLVSVKRSLLRSAEGPFDERLRFGYEDSELVCRLGPDSIRVVYNSRAKSYVLRPVKFELFCRRRYMQGRALYRVARKHPELIMPRYGLNGIAEVYQRGVGPYLDEWHNSFRETAALLDEEGRWSAGQDESLKQVYSFYCGCFMGYWLKGYLDEKQAIESGGKSISEPVNCDSGSIVIESDAAEVSTAGEDVKIEVADSDDTTGAVEHLGENLVADKPAANEGLKIAFISGTLPRFDIGSSDNRIHHIVKILAREGHKVDYLYYLETPKDEFYKRPYGADMNFVRLGTAVQDFISYFEKRDDVDCVWITNIWTAEYARPFIELCEWIRANRPGTKIIIDTMDFHYKKFLRKYEAFKDPQVLACANEFLEVEKKLYPLADEVITVSEPDKNDIHENIRRELNVGVVPNIHQVSASISGFDARKNLCFLGSFGVDHNADAVRSFLQNVWPSVLQAEGAVEFHIFGFQSEKFRAEFERHRNVKVLGYVEDAEATVANYKALVCPLLYGSGMKGKIGLAASVSTPVVTTSIGAEGFGLIDGQDGFIADDATGFAKKCLDVMRDGVTWSRLSENVRKRVAENYSVEAVREKIRSILDLTVRGDFAEGDGLSASAADAQAERERQANIYEVKSLLEQYCGGGSGPIAPVQSNLRT